MKLLEKGKTAVLIGPNVGLQSLHRKCESSKGQEEQAPLSVWVYLQKAGRGEGRTRNGKRTQKGRSEETDAERERERERVRARGGVRGASFCALCEM